MKKLFLLSVSLLSLFLLTTPVVAAELNSVTIRTDITLNEELEQTVTYEIEGTSEASEITLPLVGRGLEDVSFQLNGQANTNFEAEAATHHQGPLAVEYTTLRFNAPTTEWDVTITYTTTDLLDQGQLKTFAWPALPLGTDTGTEQIRVSLPLGAGLPVAIGLQASESEVGGGTQTYIYDFESPRAESILLDFTTEQSYGLTWDETFKNNGLWWKTFDMVFAPDSNQQAIQIDTISPTPTTLRLDRDGNIIAQFRVRPRGSVNVTASGHATVRSIRYAVDQQRTVEEVPATLDAYKQQTGIWSNGISVDGESAAERVEALLEQATAKVPEQTADTYLEFVNTMVADARASGLPARLIAGRLAHNGMQSLPNGQQHYWAEIYLPGTGWMTVDPAMNQMYDQFAQTDAFRIAEFIRGVDSEKPKANPQPVSFSKMTEPVTAAAEFTPTISQTKYLLLPGLSFVKTVVTMPAGRVVDGLGYSSGGTTYRLGSLAPLQNVEYWTVAAGTASWSENEVAVGYLTAEGIDPIATTDSKLSYVYSVIIVVALVVIVVLVRRYIRRKNRPIKLDEADEDVNIPAEDLLRDTRSSSSDS